MTDLDETNLSTETKVLRVLGAILCSSGAFLATWLWQWPVLLAVWIATVLCLIWLEGRSRRSKV